MRLKFKWFDARRRNVEDVTDLDTGKVVGHIQSHGVGFENNGGIDISMFDGKYTASVNRYDACVGFVLGVETVLNHMTKIGAPAARLSKSAA
jgi:hypothetical protein